MVAPLQDVRVVDLANSGSELAGRLLADLGAEVIKVEPPGGCPSRRLPPFDDSDSARSLYWEFVGRGKRSVVLDFRDVAERQKLIDLLRSADILIESETPGSLAGLGLDYESLAAINPALIYVSITPYGQDGPDARSPATDLTVEAAGGFVALTGDGDRPPLSIGFPQASLQAGAQAAADALVALYVHETGGSGQHVDVSMQACMVLMLLTATGNPPFLGEDPQQASDGRGAPPREFIPGLVMPSKFKCADGYVLATLTLGDAGALSSERLMAWAAEEDSLDHDLQDVSWRTWLRDAVGGTLPAEDAVRGFQQLSRFFETKTKRQLMDRAAAEKILLAPMYTAHDLLEDPQLAARGYWQDVGGTLQPGPFAKLSVTPIDPGSPAPKLGAHQALLDALNPVETTLAGAGSPPRGAFEGLKVADFAWVVAGTLISKVLADHGATVVHVESETKVDYIHLVPPYKDGVPGVNRNHVATNDNSSKLGMALNLGIEEGRQLARRLVDWADVVTESFTPGTMARLGLDYETVSKTRPDLVMISSTIRGQTGPERAFTGFGAQGSALAGFEAITGWPDRAPAGVTGAYTDLASPRYGVAVLAAALLHRQRTGQGQYIDVSQSEASIYALGPLLLDQAVNGRTAGLVGHDSLYASPHGVFATAGTERYVAIAVETDSQWEALRGLVDGLGHLELSGYDQRLQHRPEIDTAIAAWCRQREALDAANQLKRAGVPAAVANRPTDLYTDRQLTHRQFFKTLEHAGLGPVPHDGLASTFSGMPFGPHTAGPLVGQHTDHVLRNLLGLEDAEIQTYAAAGALT